MNAQPYKSGTTTGKVTGMHLHLSGPSCSYNLLGCGFLGGIHNGDHMTFSAAGAVTSPQTVTSP